MTLEERAREIANALEQYQRTFIPSHSLPVIEAALRTIRSEALEEAAKVAEGLEVDSCSVDDMEKVSARNLACYDIATAIRAMKGEGT